MDMSMTEVYDSTVNNVKNYIRAKDVAANFKRSEFDFEDLVQGFYLYLFDNKKKKNIKANDRLIDRFDQNRTSSSDPKKAMYNFVVNHLRNYYRTSMQEDLRLKKSISSLGESIIEEQTNFHNGDILPQRDQEESKLNFCFDFYKRKGSLYREFRRGLNKLEKGAYKFFIEDNLAPKEVAKKLNVTRRTAQNLRNSINFKAQQTMSVY